MNPFANLRKVWAEGTALKHANRANRVELASLKEHHPCTACGRMKPDFEWCICPEALAVWLDHAEKYQRPSKKDTK